MGKVVYNNTMRKIELAIGEVYHIFNRSIAKYKIFNKSENYLRFIELLNYYRFTNNTLSYSRYLTTSRAMISKGFGGETFVDIIAYCIMPTHFHLILKQNTENGITNYLSKVENSYSKYVNTIFKRKGPLWEARFQSVHINTDEQLLHLTRYIHLNPSSAGLVNKPEDWEYSSYHNYLSESKGDELCIFRNIIDLSSKQYQKFVNDRIAYQKELSIIKSQLIDDYSG